MRLKQRVLGLFTGVQPCGCRLHPTTRRMVFRHVLCPEHGRPRWMLHPPPPHHCTPDDGCTFCVCRK